MKIYQTVCYKVEDIFVRMLTLKTNSKIAKEKVRQYRSEKEQLRLQRNTEKMNKTAEQRTIQLQEREQPPINQRDHKQNEIEAFITKMMGNGYRGYSQYEYDEIERNLPFFQSFVETVLKPNEKALTLLFCKYDQSKKRKMNGYLIPTTQNIFFIRKDFNFTESFSYQLINHVNWVKNGYLDCSLQIQSLSRRLEFDEISDTEQLKKVRTIILQNASKKAI